MKYIANVTYKDGSMAKLFKSEEEAKEWLNKETKNGEFESTIDVMDDKGNYIDSYLYTEGHKDE